MKSERGVKICRLTWNDHGWTYPSGPSGKAKGNAFERHNGFGSEEWLFRSDFQHQGFQYGFLEPVYKYQHKHAGKTYDLHLYTIDGKSRQRYWVGMLESVSVLTKSEAEIMEAIYIKKDWFDILQSEALEMGNPTRKTKNEMRRDKFFIPNVKFPVEQAARFHTIILDPITDHRQYISSHRYSLLNPIQDYIPQQTNRGFSFEDGNPGILDPTIPSSIHRLPSKPHQSPLNHNKLMIAFQKYLIKRYGTSQVHRECPSNENRVDLVHKEDDGYVFYELKTYESVRTSLRVALGQLFDYVFFPSHQYAKKIIIVTHRKPDTETESYIRYIIKQIRIPLGFIYFDLDKKKIGLEI